MCWSEVARLYFVIQFRNNSLYTAWPNTTTSTHTNRAFPFITLWQDATCSLWLNFSFIWVLLQECGLITLCSIAPGVHKFQAYGWLNFLWYQLISSGQILKFFSYIQQCVHSCQNSGSSAWNLFHVTLLVPGLWWWLIDIWKICGLLNTLRNSTKKSSMNYNFHWMITQCCCCFHHT